MPLASAPAQTVPRPTRTWAGPASMVKPRVDSTVARSSPRSRRSRGVAVRRDLHRGAAADVQRMTVVEEQRGAAAWPRREPVARLDARPEVDRQGLAAALDPDRARGGRDLADGGRDHRNHHKYCRADHHSNRLLFQGLGRVQTRAARTGGAPAAATPA